MLYAMTYLNDPSDRNYLDSLFREHYKALYRIAFAILREKTAAEDTVINAMLSLFSKVAYLKSMDEEKRTAYLRTSVRNAAYKTYHAQKKQNLTEHLPFDSFLFSLPNTDTANDPAQALLQNEEYRIVREIIAALPTEDRQALYLKYSAGFSAREIADMIKAPSEAAIHMRLSRARNKVLILLEKRGWSYD